VWEEEALIDHAWRITHVGFDFCVIRGRAIWRTSVAAVNRMQIHADHTDLELSMIEKSSCVSTTTPWEGDERFDGVMKI
jgi:hypothetical protein